MKVKRFQHTTARRRLPTEKTNLVGAINVSTHNRPKAAAILNLHEKTTQKVSTHNRPKAAAEVFTLAFAW